MPVEIAARLTRAAEQRQLSVSDHATELIAAALRDTGVA
jgi:class 3 adenylate cyclase